MDYGKLDNFNRLKVLVLGDFMLDKYIMGSVKRISPEAPSGRSEGTGRCRPW